MSKVLLDASAVLALLHREQGCENISQYIPEGVLCTVNAAEVVGELMDAGMPEDVAISALDMLALESALFDTAMATFAGALRPHTKKIGLSLGDRACLAAAKVLAMPVVTTDRSWQEVDGLGVYITLARH